MIPHMSTSSKKAPALISESSPPLVSVIIPTYNRCAILERAIESVLGQTFTDYELIVVDDGSTDETADLLDRYRNRVKVIRQENRGVSAARNTGIRASKGELVALLDSDDSSMCIGIGRYEYMQHGL